MKMVILCVFGTVWMVMIIAMINMSQVPRPINEPRNATKSGSCGPQTPFQPSTSNPNAG